MPPEYRRQRRSTLILWVIVVLAFLVIAFYVGTRFAPAAVQPQPAVATTTPTTVQAGAEYYSNPAEWQIYSDTSAGYSIAYPIDFTVDEPASVKATTSWRMNNVDQTSGIQTFTLTIPAAFEPQTNFANALLTVGSSQSAKALSDCLLAQNGEATSSTQAINNATFTVFTSSNPGAGQLYDTTSYRTTHAGACYAVEYTVHSAELGNFPASYDLQQFDEGQVDAVLNTIVGTFTFQ